MAQIIIEYEEYLELLKSKEDLQNIKNGVGKDCYINHTTDYNGLKMVTFKPTNGKLLEIIKQYHNGKFEYFENLEIRLS